MVEFGINLVQWGKRGDSIIVDYSVWIDYFFLLIFRTMTSAYNLTKENQEQAQQLADEIDAKIWTSIQERILEK